MPADPASLLTEVPPVMTENDPAAGPDRQNPPIPPLPEDALIILPVRNLVLFPGLVLPVTVGRNRSIAAVEEAERRNFPIGVLLQRDGKVDAPDGRDLHMMGCSGKVLRYLTGQDGAHHLITQGERRFRAVEFLEGYPFLVARIEHVPEDEREDAEIEARFVHLRAQALEALDLLPETPKELVAAVNGISSAALLADTVAAYLDLEPHEKQTVLETIELKARLDLVSNHLGHRIQVMRLTREISQQTQETMSERHREYLLREQLRTIQRELGEADEKGEEVEELSRAITEAKMPEAVEEHARKELRRLERMPEAAGEYSMVRTYLDTLTGLPWSRTSENEIDIDRARRILDEDHYALPKVKRRILEFLAVRKLNPEGRSPILCFVGPPGVGKTSLGQSIARATGRHFARLSLGGVHDEAEIRGHRRTYVGAMPGNVIQAIRKAGTRDSVVMLDEMDKLGRGIQGDPAAALLEVLDPEQNSTFRDNYLGVPFDLSKVMFIGTANVLEDIPGPLRDRMEVIHLAGYTEEEKFEIARRYILGRQLTANGLDGGRIELPDETIRAIIRDYTREAGVRTLER
jgi:ATP-dependent Lon protease